MAQPSKEIDPLKCCSGSVPYLHLFDCTFPKLDCLGDRERAKKIPVAGRKTKWQ